MKEEESGGSENRTSFAFPLCVWIELWGSIPESSAESRYEGWMVPIV